MQLRQPGEDIYSSFRKLIKLTDYRVLLREVLQKYKRIEFKIVEYYGLDTNALFEVIQLDLNTRCMEYRLDNNEDNSDGKTYHRFRLERMIYHETYHSAKHDFRDIKSQLVKTPNENDAITANPHSSLQILNTQDPKLKKWISSLVKSPHQATENMVKLIGLFKHIRSGDGSYASKIINVPGFECKTCIIK